MKYIKFITNYQNKHAFSIIFNGYLSKDLVTKVNPSLLWILKYYKQDNLRTIKFVKKYTQNTEIWIISHLSLLNIQIPIHI